MHYHTSIYTASWYRQLSNSPYFSHTSDNKQSNKYQIDGILSLNVFGDSEITYSQAMYEYESGNPMNACVAHFCLRDAKRRVRAERERGGWRLLDRFVWKTRFSHYLVRMIIELIRLHIFHGKSLRFRLTLAFVHIFIGPIILESYSSGIESDRLSQNHSSLAFINGKFQMRITKGNNEVKWARFRANEWKFCIGIDATFTRGYNQPIEWLCFIPNLRNVSLFSPSISRFFWIRFFNWAD